MIVFFSVAGFLLLLVNADTNYYPFGLSRALIRTGRAQPSKLTHSMALTFRGSRRLQSSHPSNEFIDDILENEHKAWIKRKIFRTMRRLSQQDRRRV